MSMITLDADAIMARATPLAHQHAHEIPPYGHLVSVRMPIGLSEAACKEFLLFDKDADEQSELVDAIAERIQLLRGVSLAMAVDVAETTLIPRPPRGREEAPVQISRERQVWFIAEHVVDMPLARA